MEVYEYAADFGAFHFDGSNVEIATKEVLETLFSCGMCPEPRGTWKVRITPNGVDNLGQRFLQPEVHWADELLTRVGHGGDVASLASNRVVEALKARTGEEQTDFADHANPDKSPSFSWGMMGKCRILRGGNKASLYWT